MRLRDRGHRAGGLLLPFWAWVILLAIAGVTALQSMMPDQGMANGLSWMVLILAFLLIFGWFLFASPFSGAFRIRVFLLFAVVVGTLATLFQVEGLTGNIIPIFTYRFGTSASAALGSAAETKASADLRTTTEHDFPQFLGPQRDSSAPSVPFKPESPPKLLWKKPIGQGWSGFAIVNGFAVTQEQRGPDEWISCYDVETGNLRWSHRIASRYETFIAGIGPRATPTIDHGKVYAQSPLGQLTCLDGNTGSELWAVNLLKEFGLTLARDSANAVYGRSSSPLIVDDLVIVPAGGTEIGARWSLAAFDKNSGQLRWKGGDRQIGYSSPSFGVLAGVPQILSVNEDNFSAHDPATGEVLWAFDWPGRSSNDANVSQAHPLAPNRVFVSKGYGGGAVLLELQKNADGKLEHKVLWRDARVMKTKFTNATFFEGHVYGLSDGILECVHLDTGKKKWRDGRYNHGQLLRLGGSLLVLSEQGELALVAASPTDANHVHWQIPVLNGRTWNNLATYGNLVLVRNGEEMACLKLPTE